MKALFPILALLAGNAATAQTTVQVDDPWVRGTVTGQPATGAFMRLTPSAHARLVAARSPVAAVVEIHEMAMDGDVMKMRQVDAIDLPAGQTVELKPGGYHLMLMGLKTPLKAGDKLPLTLKFEKAGEVVVTVNVEHPKTGDASGQHKH